MSLFRQLQTRHGQPVVATVIAVSGGIPAPFIWNILGGRYLFLTS